MDSEKLRHILLESSSHHDHLCPRQILGARTGLAGMRALGFDEPPTHKRLLIITECDGCFVDGLTAATECTVGHRTLRVEDLGKTAATFVDTQTGQAIRVAPQLDIREKAYVYNEADHYSAQLQAYQDMPDAEMFSVMAVSLNESLEAIISKPGMRVTCDICGEEVMNEREIIKDGVTLCLSCTGESYYSSQPAFDGVTFLK
jgi:formylmethanofuran dehydrogenase subunit E